MKIEIHYISQNLKNLREQKQLTQEELAKHLGVSRQSIIALEQGKCLPSLPLAFGFSEIFNMPFEKIFCHEINQMREEVNRVMANDLSPWSPEHDISSLHETIDRLFATNEENWPTSSKTSLMPQVNVLEDGKNIVVSADLPGIREEDITVEVGDEMITISGERKNESEIHEKNYYRKEINLGNFSRTIPLPSLVNKDKAEAELKNGILKITLTKKAKALPKITKIKIKKG